LSAIARRIHVAEPEAIYSHAVHVMPLREQLVGDTSSLLGLLTGSVVLVLLIGCANLASANLAQGAHRQREMAVRSALGAGRSRLVRQVLTENILLAIVGGAAGLLLAWLCLRSVSAIGIADLPRLADATLSGRVLLLAFGVSAAAGILTGLLPALQVSRAAPNDVIGGSMRGIVFGAGGWPGRILVGAEIALALMLVTGAGLLVQSLRSVLAQPLGIETANVVTARVTLGGPRYQTDTVAFFTYWDNLLRSLREIPGVSSAGVATFVPLVNGGQGFIEVEGKDIAGAGAGYRVISEGYLDALGMSLQTGREFTSGDRRETPRVALVNMQMANTYWPGESPIGKRVRATSMEPAIDGKPQDWITVIGVVNDVRHFGHESDPHAEMFVLYRQLPSWLLGTLTAVVRGSGHDGEILGAVRQAVVANDATVPADIELLEAAARRSTASRRFATTMLEAFGVVALLLSAIGVYGVLSFSVAQRTREMAVRAALGADRGSLLRLVIGGGAAIIAGGLVAGLVGAIAGGRLLESMLFNVTARDPLVLGGATVLLALIGIVAAIIPAHRATRVDPMLVMRTD
jgi:predicted permease